MLSLSYPRTMSTLLSDHSVFKRQRANVAVDTVPPGSIIVNLYVLEYGPVQVLLCGKTITEGYFHLYSVAETFGANVVVEDVR